MSEPTPDLLLPRLVATDAARPRVTCYDDLPGPTAGERVEFSARVLTNWVSKAGNALQEEWDLGPGGRVLLRAAPHWRCLYWALAAWEVGAAIVLDGTAAADLVITDEPPTAAPATPKVLLTRAALARSAGAALPQGVLDEAAELATFGDVLEPWAQAAADEPALIVGEETISRGDLLSVAARRWPDLPAGCRLDVNPVNTADLLTAAVAAFAVDGSLVLHLGLTRPEDRVRRAVSEGVDRSL